MLDGSPDLISLKNPAPLTPAEPVREKNLTALLHFGRSGSGYLQSLIDGHPDISTLPGVYFSGFFGRDVWNHICAGGSGEMVERFCRLYEVLFDARRPEAIPPAFISDANTNRNFGYQEGFTEMGENRDTPLTLDRATFANHLEGALKTLDEVNQRDFFMAIHQAFEKTLGLKSRFPNSVLYHLHAFEPFSMAGFLNYFPDAKLLMTVRNPVPCCESWALQSLNNNRNLSAQRVYGDITHKISAMLLMMDTPVFHPFSVRFGYEDENEEHFKENLKTIRPLIGQPLGFESKLASGFPEHFPEIERTGDYKAFHAVLLGRWKILDKRGTYRDMLAPL